MSILFEQIPSNIRVPGVYVEITSKDARQGLAPIAYKTVVIGQRLPSGTVEAGVPIRVTNPEQAMTYFGRGSLLAHLFETLYANDSFTETWAVALDDVGAGKASGSITIEGASMGFGYLNLYVAGKRVRIEVCAEDVAETVAAQVLETINNDPDLPITATQGEELNIVTLTAKHSGEVGNDIDIRLNYLGELGGEVTPDGLVVNIEPLAGGLGNPDISDAISVLPDECFHYWLTPYTDASNLNALDTELERRYGPMVQLEGHAITAKSGNESTLITLGKSRNSPHVSIFDAGFESPTPSYLWAAAVCGQVSASASANASRPFTSLVLQGVLPAGEDCQRTFEERNRLLQSGISTHRVEGGAVQIERLITTYQTNSSGLPDTSYLDVNTVLTLSYLRQTYRAHMLRVYPRHKLADDGMSIAAGQPIVTPSGVRAESVVVYQLWMQEGHVQDMEGFKEDVVTERSDKKPGFVDTILRPRLVGPYRGLNVQIAFIV